MDEKPNFDMLWELVVNRNQVLNYELIVILNSTDIIVSFFIKF